MIRIRERDGQSLVEILVAVAIGVVLIAGALSIISPTIKTSSDTARIQVASALAKELMENVRVMSEGSWHAVDSLATTSVNRFYILASTSPFTATSGTESIPIATTTYTRYFYLNTVYRNVAGYIDEVGTTLDPSSRKVTVVYGWNNYVASTTSYISRGMNYPFSQTDWAGGPGQNGPVTATSVPSRFATSSNMDYSTSSGSLIIQGF